ncbi:hypothetical protein CBR_g23470 [Chara braunii]|uniref:UspA domain-containing protein n=1 Tax=Chara braunii TaxID=69332 RepID=A0A388L4B3_CHABU|nr:hypothetical protein CBR_g23470 [Chara braunii]|eukprot:GBG77144.1 hypothetical protein CBR_g23470 [Chara braunii]
MVWEMDEKGASNSKRKVLVAVDHSAGSQYALNWALEKLITPRDQVILLHVRDDEPKSSFDDESGIGELSAIPYLPRFILQCWRPEFPGDGAGGFAGGPLGRNLELEQAVSSDSEIESLTPQDIDKMVAQCLDKQIRAEALTVQGDPRERIVEEAIRRDVDLLVIGSRSPMKRTLIGSVSDYCMQQSPCPVVVVKPPVQLGQV